tara:strand:- start:258 stop:494 length:237 start_codon:yes stop_codon:yes gene_type:complete
MENEKEPMMKREQLNALQFMALIAMLLTFFTGNKMLFATAISMMCGLKAMAMVMYEDSKEAIFAAVYAGFAIFFFLDM